MQKTGRHNLSEAVAMYEEKSREQWLFDYSAQIALCATQIWWTNEVNMAFARMEEGYENALKDYNKKQVLFTKKKKSKRLFERLFAAIRKSLVLVIIATLN